MGTLLMRERLPDRRRGWTQKVHIGGQSVYLTVGEYPDGRPGEIFVDMSRTGTLLRGVMASLARMVSIALQCGADIEVVVHALRGMEYPPDGPVQGSDNVAECLSVTDWIASELEARYIQPPEAVAVEDEVSESDGDEAVAMSFNNTELNKTVKVAGHTAEAWRTGV